MADANVRDWKIDKIGLIIDRLSSPFRDLKIHFWPEDKHLDRLHGEMVSFLTRIERDPRWNWED